MTTAFDADEMLAPAGRITMMIRQVFEGI